MLNWVCDARRVTRVTEQKLTEKKWLRQNLLRGHKYELIFAGLLSFPNSFVSKNIHPLSVSRSRR